MVERHTGPSPLSARLQRLICTSQNDSLGCLLWKALTKVVQFFPFTLKQYIEFSEMFEMFASYTHKSQRTNVHVVSLPTSWSLILMKPWQSPTLKSSAYEVSDSWNKDRLKCPAVGALYYPAPGKPAKWRLSGPLPTQACHQLPNSITDLAVSPASAQPSVYMGRTSASWGKRWRWRDPCFGPQIYVVQQSPVPPDSKGSKPPLLAGVQVDETTFLML